MNLALIAEESAGIQTLNAVARASHRIVAVLTSSDPASGRWANMATVARRLNVPSWSIYLGETRHAVTVHRMAPRVDTGPIAYREDFEIGEQDTGLSLFMKCASA